MRRAKWILLVSLFSVLLAGITLGITTPTQYEARVSLRQAEYDGDRLFHSPTLGKNGLTCDTCHVDGGRFSHRLGSRRLPSLLFAQQAFPKVDSAGEVTTLEQQINQCLVRYMHTRPLAPNNRKLGLLDLYIRHLSRFHER